jgi:hypothetical protein
MKIQERLRCCWRSRISRRICARIETSRAKIVLSNTMTSGSNSSARAIAIRWHVRPRIREDSSPRPQRVARRFQQPLRSIAMLCGTTDPLQSQWLGDVYAHCHAGVQRRQCILKSNLYSTTQLPLHSARGMGERLPIQCNGARIRCNEVQNQAHKRRFAATGLTDESERLAAFEGETCVLHRQNDTAPEETAALAGEEALARALDAHRRVRHQADVAARDDLAGRQAPTTRVPGRASGLSLRAAWCEATARRRVVQIRRRSGTTACCFVLQASWNRLRPGATDTLWPRSSSADSGAYRFSHLARGLHRQYAGLGTGPGRKEAAP